MKTYPRIPEDATILRHRACGRVAFYLIGNDFWGVTDVSKFRLIDGTMPRQGDPIVCGSCGGTLDVNDVSKED